MKREKENEFQSDSWRWLIGFTEGDGCLHTDGKRHWYILIQKESKVLYRAKSIIGFGKIRKVEKDGKFNSFRLVITNREGIKKLLQAFNGQFFCQTRKIQLSRWITVWNTRYSNDKIIEKSFEPKTKAKKSAFLIVAQKNPPTVTLHDAWFSGFFDAEGGFSISITKRYDTGIFRFRVRPRIFCDQKNEPEVLNAVAAFFQAGRVTTRAQDRTQYRWMVDTWIHVHKIQAYFRRHPLRTRKHLVFLRFLKIYRMVLRKEHLTDAGLQRIRELSTRLQSVFP